MYYDITIEDGQIRSIVPTYLDTAYMSEIIQKILILKALNTVKQ